MNIQAVTKALADLKLDAMELSLTCARERMEQYALFWRAVAESAGALLSSPANRDEIEHLVSDIIGAFSYAPGAFMDMYIIRDDSKEQVRENEVFEELRTRVRDAAGRLGEAVREGEVNPLKVRRALVDLESEFLVASRTEEAQQVRALLNAPELDLAAVTSLHAEMQRRAASASANAAPRIDRERMLLKGLAAALHPGTTQSSET